MGRYIFLFDLDSVITRQAILPTVAEKAGVYEQMAALKEQGMREGIPFRQNFLQEIGLLKEIPVSEVQDIVCHIERNERLLEFIHTNKNRSYIVTENLDVWIERLIAELGMEKNVFCSRAVTDGDYVQDVFSIVDQDALAEQIVLPLVVVGNGSHDAGMIEAAEVGIGYGGTGPIAPSVMGHATHVIYEEGRLVEFLNKLV